MGTILKSLILLSAQGKVSLAFHWPERVLVISGDMMAYRQRYEWGNKKKCVLSYGHFVSKQSACLF